jgi:hypothetical protein
MAIGDNRAAMAESSNLAPVVSDEHRTRRRPTGAQLKVAAGTFDLPSIPLRLHLGNTTVDEFLILTGVDRLAVWAWTRSCDPFG